MESLLNFEMLVLTFIGHWNIVQFYQSVDIEEKCCKCEQVTKYECLEWFTFDCNFC